MYLKTQSRTVEKKIFGGGSTVSMKSFNFTVNGIFTSDEFSKNFRNNFTIFTRTIRFLMDALQFVFQFLLEQLL